MPNDNLNQLRESYLKSREALYAAEKERFPELVENYEFEGPNGSLKLLDLFNDKSELFILHNMGKSCSYCTLWADGFNGVLDHLQNRAAVAITSPDSVAVQQQFKTERQWKFTMVSSGKNKFAEDMGYLNDKGPQPGVSVFKKTDDKINRVATTPFGPGDDFCSVWHLFNLLPDGASGWQPKLEY